MSLIGPEGRKQLQVAARFMTAGLELAISIVIGYFGGRALDGWLGSEPYCAYVGLLLGVVAGFRNLFQLARRASSTASSPRPSDPPEPSPTPAASEPTDPSQKSEPSDPP